MLDIRNVEELARIQALIRGQVGGGLADLAVTAGKLAADAVTTAKLLDANVTTGKLAAGAATLPKVTFTGLKVLAAAGINGAGAITLTGTAVGDRLVAVFGSLTVGGVLVVKVPGTDFESAVTVTNQIQQIAAGNLTTFTFVFILAPAAA